MGRGEEGLALGELELKSSSGEQREGGRTRPAPGLPTRSARRGWEEGGEAGGGGRLRPGVPPQEASRGDRKSQAKETPTFPAPSLQRRAELALQVRGLAGCGAL